MDCHRSLSIIRALQTDVVFKIFAYKFENLEVFVRKVLCLRLSLLLRL